MNITFPLLLLYHNYQDIPFSSHLASLLIFCMFASVVIFICCEFMQTPKNTLSDKDKTPPPIKKEKAFSNYIKYSLRSRGSWGEVLLKSLEIQESVLNAENADTGEKSTDKEKEKTSLHKSDKAALDELIKQTEKIISAKERHDSALLLSVLCKEPLEEKDLLSKIKKLIDKQTPESIETKNNTTNDQK